MRNLKKCSKKNRYTPVNESRWTDDYFSDRNNNDSNRQKQFKIDVELIKSFVNNGNLCDVGCSTGEFVRSMKWDGTTFGMELNEMAINKAKDIINFQKNIFTETDFFDVIIFRGTIQHVDEPFRMIKECYSALKPGGYLFFIATPNINSVLYRLKKNLPMLDWPRNYYLPGDIEFLNTLKNYGFLIKKIEYPYVGTPYAKPLVDMFCFMKNIIMRRFFPHPFWGSMMNVVVQKNQFNN